MKSKEELLDLKKMEKTIERIKKGIGYKGCQNCKYRIDYFWMCEWSEHGGDGALHFICPRWEKKDGEV